MKCDFSSRNERRKRICVIFVLQKIILLFFRVTIWLLFSGRFLLVLGDNTVTRDDFDRATSAGCFIFTRFFHASFFSHFLYLDSMTKPNDFSFRWRWKINFRLTITKTNSTNIETFNFCRLFFGLTWWNENMPISWTVIESSPRWDDRTIVAHDSSAMTNEWPFNVA